MFTLLFVPRTSQTSIDPTGETAYADFSCGSSNEYVLRNEDNMAKRNTYFQDEEIYRKIDMRQFGRVLRYIFPYKKTFIFVFVLMIVSSAVSMVTPLILRKIIDDVVLTEEYRTLAFLIASMLALAALEIGITLVHQRLTGT